VNNRWVLAAKKVYQALKKDGIAITLVIHGKDGDYDKETAKRKTFKDEYVCHGIFKESEIKSEDIINPEEVELIFHAGKTIGDIPNLKEQDRVEIIADGIIYKIVRLKTIRPAGVTLMYKAIVKESENEW